VMTARAKERSDLVWSEAGAGRERHGEARLYGGRLARAVITGLIENPHFTLAPQ
jgi:hypothetical protein